MPRTLLRDALDAARGISNNHPRAIALAALAPRLPETERQAVLRDALEGACAISDDAPRARALAILAPHLPEELLHVALESVDTISHAGCQWAASTAILMVFQKLGQLDAVLGTCPNDRYKI